METKTGNSNFQLQIERKMLLSYAKKAGIKEFDEKSPVLKGCSVQIDGYSKKKRVACEAYAHIGKLKSGQLHKVAQDILKLIYLDEKIGGKKHNKVLLFADKIACKSFRFPEKLKPSQSIKWIADCLNEFNIKTWVFRLSLKDRKELLKWQGQQGKNFTKKL